MKRNKAIAFVLSTALFALALTACGSQNSNGTPADDNSQSGGDASEPIHVSIGVTGAVHEQIWAPAIETLKGEGIEVELVQFSDFTLPNNALANGDIDLDAFQHHLYLDSEIESYGYDLTKIATEYSTHMNLFSEKIDSIDQLKDGDVIAIPNDPTNGGAALKILQDAGILTLKADSAFSPTVDDIESYNYNVKIEELAANTIPSALPDVTAAIVNVNYAIDYGFKMDDALYVGDLNEEPYWTLIAARTEDLSDPDKVAVYDKIVKAFQSEGTKKVYEETFGGYYEPAGWDEDLLAPYKNA